MSDLRTLDVERTALLVVDIQERLMGVIHDSAGVLKNSALLMKAAGLLGLPLIATTQYAEKIGPLLPEIQAELNGVEPLDKLEFNCFANAAIRAGIEALAPGIDTLIICGVESHICIHQTVLGARLAGYRAWVPADAVSSRAAANHRTGLSRMGAAGAVIGNTEMAVYELLGRAGGRVFKALLPFLK